MFLRATQIATACLTVIVSVSATLLASDNGFEGVWVNVDAKTRNITKIAIQEKADANSIRAFGAMLPADYDFGSTQFHTLGESVKSETQPYGFASWDEGFCIYHLTLQLTDEKLIVTTYNIFKDNSNRTNIRSQEEFRKAHGNEAELPPEKNSK